MLLLHLCNNSGRSFLLPFNTSCQSPWSNCCTTCSTSIFPLDNSSTSIKLACRNVAETFASSKSSSHMKEKDFSFKSMSFFAVTCPRLLVSRSIFS